MTPLWGAEIVIEDRTTVDEWYRDFLFIYLRLGLGWVQVFFFFK